MTLLLHPSPPSPPPPTTSTTATNKDTVQIGKIDKVEICYRVWEPLQWKIFEIYRTLLLLIIPCSIILVSYSLICIG